MSLLHSVHKTFGTWLLLLKIIIILADTILFSTLVVAVGI